MEEGEINAVEEREDVLRQGSQSEGRQARKSDKSIAEQEEEVKEENLELVKQAITNEYGIKDELATVVAKAALEGVGRSLAMLADRLLKLEEDNK